MYETWLIQNGKAYNAIGEKERRYEVFKNNLKFIDEENLKEGRTFKLGLNGFADLTNEEYRLRYLGSKMNPNRNDSKIVSDRYSFLDGERLPEFVDWRTKGAVAPVKNQGSCGKAFRTFVHFKFLRFFCCFI